MSFFRKYAEVYPAEIARLCRARAAGRFAHSFLIRCDDETVRREFAVVLAQIGGCPHSKNGVPDTRCPYCAKLENGTYSEFHTLSPCGKMYQIRVGEIGHPEPNTVRSFLDTLSLTGSEAFPVKIGLIRDADRLNDAAQNALLKTLEEPPDETFIILSTANVASLLPTTRSRCQLISLAVEHRTIAFPGAETLFGVLNHLISCEKGDLGAAEEGAATLIALFGKLSDEAEAKSEEDFADQFKVAKQMEDPVFLKNLEERRQDAASGDYMRMRKELLSAIHTFAAECYMLSQGIRAADLPHREVFPGELPEFTPARGKAILDEAETLLSTLRFNVPEELALRSFAVNLVMAAK